MKSIGLTKRLTALFMIGVMMLSMGACSNNKDKVSNTGGASVPKTVADGADPSQLEPYTLTMAYIGESYEDTAKVEEKINEILQPKFNMSLKLLPLSWGDMDQKLTLMLSGDESLDLVPVIYGHGGSYLNNGYVLDMKELIDTYGGTVKRVIGEDNLYACNINGKIYGTPVCKEQVANVGVMMRKDLLEQSGYTTEDIKSIDDLDKVYAKVKEQNPGMIMLAGRQSDTPGASAKWCDSLGDNLGVIMPDDEIGTVVNYFDTEQFKHNAEVMYEFAQKGYISKDCATTNENRAEQVKADLAFSYFTPIKPGGVVQDSMSTGHEMTYAMLTDGFRDTGSIAWMGWGIGRNCKYPERAMEVLDYMYGSAEIMNLIDWGIEGEHYVVKDQENGIIGYPDGVTGDNKTYGLNIGFEIQNQFIAYKWEGSDPDLWEQYKKYNEEAKTLVSTGFIFDNSSVATEVAALSNVVSQYLDSIGSGAVDPKEAIPEFNKALEKAGLQTVIKEKQKQLDQFLASK